MSQQMYSVEQVADLLGLHVRTVRGYVRDGRLKATRIGKQYRIAANDLAAFTGMPAPTPATPTPTGRHVEVSSVVQIDAISPQEMSRLSTYVLAAAGSRPSGDEPLRAQTIYDEEAARLRIVLFGGVESCAELLRVVGALLADRP